MTKLEFHNLFNKVYTPLCNYANAILNDADQSEDLVQDVLYNFWKKRDQITVAEDKIENYLIRSVKFKCIDHHRQNTIKRKYESEVSHTDVGYDVQNEDESVDYKSILFEAITQLPEKTRAVFVLSKIDGLRYQEIAEKMNISPKTVENQMSRAFKHLREIIKDKNIFTLLILFLGGQ